MNDPEKRPHLMQEQQHRRLFGLEIYLTPVFVVSSLAILLFIFGALVFQDDATKLFGDLRVWLTTTFDWVFMLTANVVLLFCLILAFSPLGRIRLGGADATPDYSYLTWLAMIFAAGVGIGLLFFGVLEPVTYFQSPPLGIASVYDSEVRYNVDNVPDVADPDVQAAASLGIAATVFHWGLHGWAIYGVVGLTLAFYTYNRGFPLLIRSAFYPVFGERVWGWTGHIIDTFAIFAGIFGLATSLGLGVQQVTAGLNYLFGVPATELTMVLLIIGITAIALISVITGIDVGIKRLSQFNILLAFCLLAILLVLGPTAYIFRTLFSGIGSYVQQIVPLSNWIGREDTDFLHGWTTFYWAWWIAWAPFIGIFIARISKGRTVREFIIFVLFLPTVLCLLWFSAFGGTALHQFLTAGYTGVTEVVEAYKPELALFKMFEVFPWASVLSCIGMTLTIVFFVTSSDSGSLIIDIIAAGGKVDAPIPQRVFWCTVEGLIAIALLLGGGLKSLQAAALATGFPFAIVLVGMAVCVWIGLRKEAYHTQE